MATTPSSTKTVYKTVTEYPAQTPAPIRDLYDSLHLYLTELGDDVQVKTTKVYIAYRRLRNFACVEVHSRGDGKLLVYVKVAPDTVELVDGFTRDVREIGHFGTGDLEITITSPADLEVAKPLIEASYQAS